MQATQGDAGIFLAIVWISSILVEFGNLWPISAAFITFDFLHIFILGDFWPFVFATFGLWRFLPFFAHLLVVFGHFLDVLNCLGFFLIVFARLLAFLDHYWPFSVSLFLRDIFRPFFLMLLLPFLAGSLSHVVAQSRRVVSGFLRSVQSAITQAGCNNHHSWKIWKKLLLLLLLPAIFATFGSFLDDF